MSENPPNLPVLVVDDEEIILLALRETLAQEGYQVVTVNSPVEGLEKLKEQPFAVILSDQRMAEMTGLEFLAEAKKLQPSASRILITGVLTLKTVIDAVNKGEIFRFLAKPWIREELVATLRNAYQRYVLMEANERLQADTLKLNTQLQAANEELRRRIQEISQQKTESEVAQEALRRNFDHSIELCYRLISTFYPILGAQTKAIVDICQLICDSGHLDETEQRVLKVAAWLQNIGLIGISREVLSRYFKSPETLTEREEALIQHHPVYGQTLAGFVDNLQEVGATIRAHHERWDGQGFPDGLAAEMIPRPARFLAVAVYYVESGLDRDPALEAIVEQSGKAFDPEAVRLFLKVTRLAALPKAVREVLFSELRPGMVLARGIYSPGGLLLIPEGALLTEQTLYKIREHNQVDPLDQRLMVFA